MNTGIQCTLKGRLNGSAIVQPAVNLSIKLSVKHCRCLNLRSLASAPDEIANWGYCTINGSTGNVLLPWQMAMLTEYMITSSSIRFGNNPIICRIDTLPTPGTRRANNLDLNDFVDSLSAYLRNLIEIVVTVVRSFLLILNGWISGGRLSAVGVGDDEVVVALAFFDSFLVEVALVPTLTPYRWGTYIRTYIHVNNHYTHKSDTSALMIPQPLHTYRSYTRTPITHHYIHWPYDRVSQKPKSDTDMSDTAVYWDTISLVRFLVWRPKFVPKPLISGRCTCSYSKVSVVSTWSVPFSYLTSPFELVNHYAIVLGHRKHLTIHQNELVSLTLTSGPVHWEPVCLFFRHPHGLITRFEKNNSDVGCPSNSW